MKSIDIQNSNSTQLLANVSVLLAGHGSVNSVNDIPAFLSNIRHGRPTPQSIVDEVTLRWKAIGGSPFLKIAQAQAEALQARLNVPVEVGMRLWHPYIKDVVSAWATQERRRVVSLPLAPFSVHIYNATVREACAAFDLECFEAKPWGQEPALLEAFAEAIESAWQTLSEPQRSHVHLLCTAHSLPMRVLQSGDSYEQEVRHTAESLLCVIKTRDRCNFVDAHVAFQSQGMDGGDWLGPDLRTTFLTLRNQNAHNVLVCAIGFLSDHTEILYDLDIEAKTMAQEYDINLIRAASLNTSTRFIDALENRVWATLRDRQ